MITLNLTGFTLKKRKYWTPYLFLLPSLLIIALFVVWPILNTAWLSLHDASLFNNTPLFIEWENYSELFYDERFWGALKNTFYYTVAVVLIRVPLALGFAVLLNQKMKGVYLYRSLIFLPVIGSLAVEAIIWKFLLDPEIGMISYYSRLLGLPTSEWLRSTTWAMPAIILVSIWRWVGFNMVIFLAGLQNISPDLYEAAKIDGANRWHRFIHITVPMLRPTLLFVVIDAVITSFQVFDQVFVMTKGGPLFSTETLVTYSYHQGFEIFRIGYASSIAFVLFSLIFVITLFQLKWFRFRETY